MRGTVWHARVTSKALQKGVKLQHLHSMECLFIISVNTICRHPVVSLREFL